MSDTLSTRERTLTLRYDPELAGTIVRTDRDGTLVYGPGINDVCLAFMVRVAIENDEDATPAVPRGNPVLDEPEDLPADLLYGHGSGRDDVV